MGKQIMKHKVRLALYFPYCWGISFLRALIVLQQPLPGVCFPVSYSWHCSGLLCQVPWHKQRWDTYGQGWASFTQAHSGPTVGKVHPHSSDNSTRFPMKMSTLLLCVHNAGPMHLASNWLIRLLGLQGCPSSDPQVPLARDIRQHWAPLYCLTVPVWT